MITIRNVARLHWYSEDCNTEYIYGYMSCDLSTPIEDLHGQSTI